MGNVLQLLRIPETRKKVLTTLALLIAYRVGFQIPIPGVSPDVVADASAQGGTGEAAASGACRYRYRHGTASLEVIVGGDAAARPGWPARSRRGWLGRSAQPGWGGWPIRSSCADRSPSSSLSPCSALASRRVTPRPRPTSR